MQQELSEVLDDLMLENNLTLTDLSNAIPMDYKQLSNYLKGKFVPSVHSALKIANYFKCSLDYLCGLTEERGNNNYKEPDFLFYERYNNLLQHNNTKHYRLCKYTGININDSRLWKNGAIPNLSTLIKIANYLNVSIEYLIGRSDTP